MRAAMLDHIVDELVPPIREPRRSLIRFVRDRPGQDFRYAMDTSKIRQQLGWSPSLGFEAGLFKTVRWYLENRAWWQQIKERGYLVERTIRQPTTALPIADERTISSLSARVTRR